MNTNDINTAWLKSNTLANTTSDNKAQNIEEKYSNRFNQLVRQDRPHSQAKKETFDDNNFYPMYWTQRFIKGDPSTIRYGMQPPPEPHDDPSIVIYGMQPPPEPHDDPSIIRYGMQPPSEPHADPSVILYGMQPPPVPHDDPSIIRYGMQPPPDDNPNLHHLYNIEVLPDKPVFLRPKPEFVQNKDKNLEFDNTQFMKIFTNLFAVFSSALGNAVGQIRR
jgi:hypothetical protein